MTPLLLLAPLAALFFAARKSEAASTSSGSTYTPLPAYEPPTYPVAGEQLQLSDIPTVDFPAVELETQDWTDFDWGGFGEPLVAEPEPLPPREYEQKTPTPISSKTTSAKAAEDTRFVSAAIAQETAAREAKKYAAHMRAEAAKKNKEAAEETARKKAAAKAAAAAAARARFASAKKVQAVATREASKYAEHMRAKAKAANQ